MKAFAAGRLTKTHKAKGVQPIPHFAGRFHYCRKRDFWPRIEIEDKAAWHFRSLRLAIPGMELKCSDLRDSGQTLHSIDFEIGLAVAEDRDALEQVRGAGHGVA